MESLVEKKSEIDEDTWNAWLHKGKLREQATARKWKRLALIILPIGVVIYFLAVK